MGLDVASLTAQAQQAQVGPAHQRRHGGQALHHPQRSHQHRRVYGRSISATSARTGSPREALTFLRPNASTSSPMRFPERVRVASGWSSRKAGRRSNWRSPPSTLNSTRPLTTSGRDHHSPPLGRVQPGPRQSGQRPDRPAPGRHRAFGHHPV